MHRSMTAIFLALAPVGALSLIPAAPAQAQQIAISVSLFHQELAPHGRWFQHPRYGWAWFPTEVDSQWRPYAHGKWVWTEQYGWYWNSDEPFGWATYHYGRWGYDETYGWIWIPGNTWGPAWVAFRYSEGHVGWAPLPPETLGISYGFDSRHTDMTAAYYAPRWVFVARNRFLDARVYASAAPWSQNTVYIRQTVNVTNYVTVNNVVINRSIDRQRIEAAIGRRIEVARVRDVDNARKSGMRGEKEIEAFRPQMRMTPDAAPPETARAKPGERPRYAVRKDATPPSERRAGPSQPASPRDTADPKARPGQPPATVTPSAPPDRARPPQRSVVPAKPGEPPRAGPDGRDKERRGATPAKPAEPPAAGPPTGAQRDRDRKAQPAAPPAKVAPSAPPSRLRTQPERDSAPTAKPDKPPKDGADGKNDEMKRDEKPGR